LDLRHDQEQLRGLQLRRSAAVAVGSEQDRLHRRLEHRRQRRRAAARRDQRTGDRARVAGRRRDQSEAPGNLRDRQREQRAVHVQDAGILRQDAWVIGSCRTITMAQIHSVRRAFVLSWLFCAAASAQVPEKSCDAFLPSPRQVKGKAVGPTSCLMQETSTTYERRVLTRLDVGLDGTVDGYLAKVGNYKEYFSNSPDLVFAQTWGPREIFSGVAAYERAKGASMTIVFPREGWNGKMWVTVHGRGTS